MLIINDCIQTFRPLWKRPWQSLAIFLILAAGIGVSSAFYAVTQALILRPFPFDPDSRLLDIEQRLQPSGSRLMNSHQNLNDLRDQSRTLDGVAAYQRASGTITAIGQTEYAQGMKVDRYFFPLIGVAPALGRGFTAEDEDDGAPRSIILSFAFWQGHLAGDPAIVGQRILVDKRPVTVIGVMPQSFYFPFIEQAEEDFWLPLRDHARLRGDYDKYGIARIKRGVSRRQAEAEMALIASHMRQENPGSEAHSFNLRPYRQVIVQELRPMLLILAGIIACFLLAVCINVASLLLVQAMRYRHDVEMRFALGGSRWQIARLFLLRAFALAMLGGLAGAGLAGALVLLARKLLPPGFPGVDQITLNLQLLWFALALSVGTGILFGLWPALAATRKLHKLSLNGTRQTVMANSMQRSRRRLVVLQLTFSTIFLVVTSLLGLSFYRLLNVKTGIQLDHRLLLMIKPTDPDLKTVESLQQFYSRLREQLLSIAGVKAVAVSSMAPLGAHSIRDFHIKDVPPPKNTTEWMAQDNAVSANYFRELGIPVREGRSFSNDDLTGGNLVSIVNEAFASRFFGTQSPIGRQICISSGDVCAWREIVAVVADAHDSRIDSPPEPAYFIPFSQAPPEFLGAAAFTVRTRIATAPVLGVIQKQMLKLAPRAVGTGPYTLQEMRSMQLEGPRHRVWFLAAITILALLLAAIGLYGVIAEAVEQRRREIGVRVAVGASPRRIAVLFYRQVLFMLLPGLVIGLAGASIVVGYISSILYETAPMDPVAYGGAAFVLSAVAAMATVLPVRRALRVTAAEVLRAE